jgi:hypothetical protein
MTRFNRSLNLVLATVTSATLLTLEHDSFAAKGRDCSGAQQSKPAASEAEAPPSWQPTVIVKSPLTLSVAAPSGGTLRLVYVLNEGWRFADRAAEPTAKVTAVTAAVTPNAQEDSASDQPLTVFIDGPSGYTYVWLRDEGWKFVGRITDQKH